MYSIIKYIVNFAFIFSTINDNYLCDITHNDSILKIIMGLFIVVNYRSFITFGYTKNKNIPFLLLIGAILVSCVINIAFYANLEVPINLLVAIISIFIVFSQEKEPYVFLWFYVLSVLYSSFICIFSNETITEWTYRKTGGVGDPNEFSVYVLVSVGFLLGYLLKNNVKFFYKIVFVVMLFIYFLSLIYAGSKSAMLTFVLMFLFYIYSIIFKFRFKHKVLFICGICVSFIIVGFSLFYFYSDFIFLYIDRFSDNTTVDTRFASWSGGWQMFKDNPIFGVGFSNYVNSMIIYKVDIGWSARAAHNMYVQCFTELGLLGFFSFLWFLFKPVKYYFQYKFLPFELILSFIVILIMGMTLSHLAEKYVWIIFALMYNRYLWLDLTKTTKRKVY